VNNEGCDLVDRMRRFAMPEGPVDCRGTWLRQEGAMRLAVGRPWMPFSAEQWFEGDGIDFRWRAQFRMAPFLHGLVVDSFERGSGSLTVNLLGLIPLARSRGPATDAGEALRGLAEILWRPSALRESPLVTWDAVAPQTLRATYDDGKTRVAAEFQVGGDGSATTVFAPHRPRLVGSRAVDTPWLATVGGYAVFEGLRVPTEAEVAWHLPESPFTYWRARVVEFRLLR
jgi:hypothetical protein